MMSSQERIASTNTIDINKDGMDKYGNTLLMHAVYTNNFDVVKEEVIKPLGHINCKNKSGDTALIIGASLSDVHKDILWYLIDHGANINYCNKEGDNALLFLSRRPDSEDLIKYLLDNDVDVDQVNEDGYTALMVAISYGNEDIVKLLVKNGADVNATTSVIGDTPVLISVCSTAYSTVCSKRNLSITEYLLENGADIMARNNNNLGMIDIALENDNVDVLNYICKKYPDVMVPHVHKIIRKMHIWLFICLSNNLDKEDVTSSELYKAYDNISCYGVNYTTFYVDKVLLYRGTNFIDKIVLPSTLKRLTNGDNDKHLHIHPVGVSNVGNLTYYTGKIFNEDVARLVSKCANIVDLSYEKYGKYHQYKCIVDTLRPLVDVTVADDMLVKTYI